MIVSYITLKKGIIVIGLAFSITLLLFYASLQRSTIVSSMNETVFFSLPTKQFSAVEPARVQFQPLKTIISEEKKASFPFDALSVRWEEEIPEGTILNVYVRFLLNERWSQWQLIGEELDEKDEQSLPPGIREALVLTNPAEKFQYKVELLTLNQKVTPVFKNPKFTYYNSHAEPDPSVFVDPRALIAQLSIISDDSPRIISRAQWGADESIRISKTPETHTPESEISDPSGENADKNNDQNNFTGTKIVKSVTQTTAGEELRWPLEYTDKVVRFVIHHTATSTSGALQDPKAAIRSIYYYHAVTRGWGDIGYNYLIDPEGGIYEGRAGGDGVVAGHAGPANKGSIGIAVLGNYQEKEPQAAALKSLLDLIVAKSRRHSINPDGFSHYKDELTPNVLGHRDVMDTSCPGHRMYAQLPYIRLLAGRSINGTRQDQDPEYAFEEVSERIIQIMLPETTSSISLKLKNTGTATWTKETYLVHDINNLRQDIVTFSQPYPDQPSRIAYLDQDSVSTGQFGTFTFFIKSDLKAGLTNYYLFPVFNGGKRSRRNVLLPIIVEPPALAYTIVDTALPKGKVKAGMVLDKGWLKLQNTGTIAWTNEESKTVCLQASSSGECVGTLSQSEVKPGEFGYFTLRYTPLRGGYLTEQLNLVMSSLGRADGPLLSFTLDVEGKTYRADFVAQNEDNIVKPGQTIKGWLELKNIGDAVWLNSAKNPLGIYPIINPVIKLSAFDVPKGKVGVDQTVKITFDLTAPKKAGTYTVYFWPRLGRKNVSRQPLRYTFIVTRFPQRYQQHVTQNLNIRILLGFKGKPVIGGDGDYSLYFGNTFEKKLSLADKVEVSYEQNVYRVKHGRQALVSSAVPRFVPDSGTILQITNYENYSSSDKSINYNRFKGVLEVNHEGLEAIVINELYLEDYLKGLAEAPNDEKLIEKAKATTVAARTYAYFYLDSSNRKFPGKPYDGNDDPAVFQYYLGYEFEKRVPVIVKAVELTKGEVVTYEGNVIKTPYFSSDDGRTRSAEEAFGWTNTPYLLSVPDPYCEGKQMRGHGVGMSGCGSEGAALAGKTYIEILKYYYTGVQIRKKW